MSEPKCNTCLHSRPIVSENGMHYNCTLGGTKPLRCIATQEYYQPTIAAKMPDAIKNGADLYTLEEVKAILQQKWTIHLQEKLYRSALALIQQLETQNAEQSENIKWMEAEQDDLKRVIRQLQVELDAAVKDLKARSRCSVCRNSESSEVKEPCFSCLYACNVDNFEWRGIQKEE